MGGAGDAPRLATPGAIAISDTAQISSLCPSPTFFSSNGHSLGDRLSLSLARKRSKHEGQLLLS